MSLIFGFVVYFPCPEGGVLFCDFVMTISGQHRYTPILFPPLLRVLCGVCGAVQTETDWSLFD